MSDLLRRKREYGKAYGECEGRDKEKDHRRYVKPYGCPSRQAERRRSSKRHIKYKLVHSIGKHAMFNVRNTHTADLRQVIPNKLFIAEATLKTRDNNQKRLTELLKADPELA